MLAPHPLLVAANAGERAVPIRLSAPGAVLDGGALRRVTGR